eukprot:CAMPEP_0206055336 /NCGR_PEP_ID=MMETSP1466-20131121/39897_1 /ASSEMBLY_ACC=CAM_ASM_001126 /TAXON_ID=44452 /ORGANISM="Pavlova gyrans, Strain CCMP608" /LENGTH=262 /DNA_ID=CAMNT_0053430561 /DNA_START=21 /DNA_END=809 /DNA_ORIENTATION=+
MWTGTLAASRASASTLALVMGAITRPDGTHISPRAAMLPAVETELSVADRVRALPSLDLPDAHETLEAIEGLDQRPLTPAFLDLAIRGDWSLVRSIPGLHRPVAGWEVEAKSSANPSSANPEAAGAGREDADTSDFRMGGAKLSARPLAEGSGTMDTAIEWTWAEQGARGTFTVRANYALTLTGHIEIERTDAEVVVDVELEAAAAGRLMGLVQEGIPPSVLDPHLTLLGIAYLDPEVLVIAHVGRRHKGTRDTWFRVNDGE